MRIPTIKSDINYNLEKQTARIKEFREIRAKNRIPNEYGFF